MGKTVSELIKRKHKCLGVSHHFYLFLKIHKISSCVAGSKNVLKQKCWPIFKGYQKILGWEFAHRNFELIAFFVSERAKERFAHEKEQIARGPDGFES